MGNEQSSPKSSSPTNPGSISPNYSLPQSSDPAKILSAPLTPVETSVLKPMPITTRARTSSETELKYQEVIDILRQGELNGARQRRQKRMKEKHERI